MHVLYKNYAIIIVFFKRKGTAYVKRFLYYADLGLLSQ